MTLRNEIVEFMNSQVSKEALRIKTYEEFSEYLADEILRLVQENIDNWVLKMHKEEETEGCAEAIKEEVLK